MSAHEDKIEEIYMKCVYKHHCLKLWVNKRLFLVSGTLITVQQGLFQNQSTFLACLCCTS